ncbi:MAG TPA: ATP-binding protein [Terracidiphilus sp.]|nr:ATP-binding protein [Terracidiphilus sp.]
MNWFAILRWFLALLVVAIVTVLLSLAGINETAAGLVFLTMVVWFATRAGIRRSLFIALLCAVCFDYFFLPPFHTLRLAGPQEWIEMFSFLVSSVIVGRLAERARRETRQAEQRREDVERLYRLGQEMMLHEDAARLIRDLPRLIERSFVLETVILYVCDQDQFYSSISEVPAVVQAGLRALTAGHNSAFGDMEGYSSLALMLGLKPIGALAWRPDCMSKEVATAVSAQVAIALTRSLAIETYTRIEAAREGERLRTALIDSLTHELRTPLTSIRAAATTLVHSEGLDEAVRSDLASLVDEESSRLDRLIGEAVEMAEIDANVVQVRVVPQHTRALLDHAVQESRAILARHRVVMIAEPPDKPAWFDPHLLGRVFRHLLENSARYAPAGSCITLSSRRREGRLEFSVQDDGPGIDAKDLPLIFEKFYRGKKGTALGKGTGMGLAIARAIVMAHGGQIDVTSQAGQGATFHFWVPLVEKESDVIEPDPTEGE